MLLGRERAEWKRISVWQICISNLRQTKIIRNPCFFCGNLRVWLLSFPVYFGFPTEYPIRREISVFLMYFVEVLFPNKVSGIDAKILFSSKFLSNLFACIFFCQKSVENSHRFLTDLKKSIGKPSETNCYYLL